MKITQVKIVAGFILMIFCGTGFAASYVNWNEIIALQTLATQYFEILQKERAMVNQAQNALNQDQIALNIDQAELAREKSMLNERIPAVNWQNDQLESGAYVLIGQQFLPYETWSKHLTWDTDGSALAFDVADALKVRVHHLKRAVRQ